MEWGANITHQIWNLTFQIWGNRNKILHNNNNIDNLQGMDLLKSSITAEHSTGLDDLPTVYQRYFNIPIQQLLHKSTLYLKPWFLIIRSGRKASSRPI